MKRAAILSYLLPRLQDFIFILVFLLGVMLGPRFLGDGDTGRHIVVGRIVLTQFQIPRTDVFSQPHFGQPLTTTEWLSEAVYAAAYLALGMNGVILLAAILIAVTLTLVFRESAENSKSLLLAFGLFFLILFGTLFHWLARPHLFSWLLLATWLPRMDRLARGTTKNTWQFPLLMLFWSNLHGGFVIGFLVWFAYLAGWLADRLFGSPASVEVLKRFFVAGLSSFAATLINPSGIRLWQNVLGHVGEGRLMSLQIDWRSPNFHNPNTWPFLLFIALLIFAASRGKQSGSRAHSFLLAGMVLLALYSVRNIPFCLVASAPILGALAQDWTRADAFQRVEATLRGHQAGLRGVAWPVLAVLAAAVLLVSGQRLDVGRLGNTYDPSRFPVQAVDWLSVNPQPGNVFNEFTWGGYILFRLWPEQKVFIDGQTDAYSLELVDDYLTALNVREGWDGVLQKYQIDWALLPPDVPLAEALLSSSSWRVLYQDHVAVILARK